MKNVLCLLILFSVTFVALGQQEKLIVQLGHGGFVKTAILAPDKKLLASYGTDDEIFLWDIENLSIRKTLKGHHTNINQVCFSPDGKQIASAAFPELKIWNTKTFAETSSWTAGNSKVASIAFSPDGKQLLTINHRNKLVIWTVATGLPIDSLQIFDAPLHSATIKNIPGTAAFVIRCNEQHLIFDLAERRVLNPAWPENYTTIFNATYKQGYVLQKGEITKFDTNTGVEYWKIFLPENTTTKSTNRSTFYQLNAEEDLLFVLKDTRLMVINTLNGTVNSSSNLEYTGIVGGIFPIYKNPNYVLMITYDGKLQIVDAKTGKLFRTSEVLRPKINSIATHPTKPILALADDYGNIREIDLSTLDIAQSWKTETEGLISGIEYSPDGNSLCIGNTQMGFTIYDLRKKNTLRQITFEKLLDSLPDLRMDYIHSFQFIKARNAVFIGTGATDPGFVSVHNIIVCHDSTFVPLAVNENANAEIACVAKNGTQLINGTASGEIQFWNKSSLLFSKKIHNKAISHLAISKDEKYIATSSIDGSVTITDRATYKQIQQISIQSQVTQLSFLYDSKFLLTFSSENQRIEIWNTTTGKLHATLIAAENKDEFIIYTPDNYYFGSKNRSKNIQFEKAGKLYQFQQFDLLYNRPEIIMERLGYSSAQQIDNFRKLYQKRLNKFGYKQPSAPSKWSQPSIRVSGIDKMQLATNQSWLEITVNSSDSINALDRLLISVNGVPMGGVNGIKLSDKPTQIIDWKQRIELNNGINQLSVSTFNVAGTESLRELFYIQYSNSDDSNLKPSLYLICIGASKYKNANMNLTYAKKDAENLIQLYKKRKKEYKEIYIDSFIDQGVRLERLQEIRTKLLKSTIHDEVIIFYAGHGVLDANFDYYLGAYAMNFSNPIEGGIPYTALENLLDGIPARKKILLLDACHSGEIDKDELQHSSTVKEPDGEISFRSFPGAAVKQIDPNTSTAYMKELFADLRNGNGTTVISSAGGGEYAMEGKEWNNGVFTWSVMNGLSNKEADLNQDGSIYLSELQPYLQHKVFSLTKGKQRPTSRIENTNYDWKVW